MAHHPRAPGRGPGPFRAPRRPARIPARRRTRGARRRPPGNAGGRRGSRRVAEAAPRRGLRRERSHEGRPRLLPLREARLEPRRPPRRRTRPRGGREGVHRRSRRGRRALSHGTTLGTARRAPTVDLPRAEPEGDGTEGRGLAREALRCVHPGGGAPGRRHLDRSARGRQGGRRQQCPRWRGAVRDRARRNDARGGLDALRAREAARGRGSPDPAHGARRPGRLARHERLPGHREGGRRVARGRWGGRRRRCVARGRWPAPPPASTAGSATS